MSRQVWSLALPVLLQQGILMFVALYDQWLAGNFLPTDGTSVTDHQAAQTTGNYLGWYLSNTMGLVTVGATAMVARFVGAADLAGANRVAHQALTLALAVGGVVSLVGALAVGPVIGALSLGGGAGPIAVAFLQPLLWLVAFQIVEQAGVACLVGAGDTKTGLWVLGGVALLNIPLARLFFLGVGDWNGMGLPGIALGTALSHVVGAVAVLGVLARGRFGLKLRLPSLRLDFSLWRRLLRIGVPASLDSMSMGACQLWFLSLVNALGTTASTAHGLAIRWESLGYLAGHAFATAASSLVGQALGAKRPDRAASLGWRCLGLGGAVMSLSGVAMFVLAPQMFALMCPHPDQAGVVAEGVPVLRLVAFAMPPLAAVIVLTGALRGAGDTRWPMLFTWVGFLVIRLPLAYWLMFESVALPGVGAVEGMGLGLYGAWVAMAADLWLRGVFFALRFRHGGWKRVRV